MRSLVFSLATLAILVVGTVDGRKHWGLLVAGTKTWGNYRHQADVCHAYQVFYNAGVPDKQVIVMMYNDIGYSRQNPLWPSIYNRNGGPDVYGGVPDDYIGNQVTAQLFYAILHGDQDLVANLTGLYKKVIKSDPEDHIFIYFAGFGGPGILSMPILPHLKARDVIGAIKSMHEKKRYSQLTFYVEASEAGSFFEGILPEDINVYVTTATNAHEQSHACYLNETIHAYLGDVYSVNWLEDTDKADLQKETLQQQYVTVKRETNTSHVMQYGDTSIAQSTLDKFFGRATRKSQPESFPSPSIKDAVPSEMVGIELLKSRINKAPANSFEKANLEKELQLLEEEMKQTHQLFNNIARTVYRDLPDNKIYDLALKERNSVKNWDCYETALDTLFGFCPGIAGDDGLVFRKLYTLVNLCNDQEQGKVIYAIESATAFSPICLK